jgi:hypothetical protein
VASCWATQWCAGRGDCNTQLCDSQRAACCRWCGRERRPARTVVYAPAGCKGTSARTTSSPTPCCRTPAARRSASTR